MDFAFTVSLAAPVIDDVVRAYGLDLLRCELHKLTGCNYHATFSSKVNRPFGYTATTFADHKLDHPCAGHDAGVELNVPNAVTLLADGNLYWLKFDLDNWVRFNHFVSPYLSR